MITLKKINKLYHVGSLYQNDKCQQSYEGDGLSVSLHPNEWRKIAKLSGSEFTLTKEIGVFADYYSFDREYLNKWGVDNGFIVKATLYKATFYHEDEECFMLFIDRDEAEAECSSNGDESLESLTEVDGFIPTNLMHKSMKVITNHSIYHQHLFTIYVQAEHPNVDGVWIDDELDVYGLSAPCGVIFEHKLAAWNITKSATN
jgi:hypothetical protein